jgi:hypothetical protein
LYAHPPQLSDEPGGPSAAQAKAAPDWLSPLANPRCPTLNAAKRTDAGVRLVMWSRDGALPNRYALCTSGAAEGPLTDVQTIDLRAASRLDLMLGGTLWTLDVPLPPETVAVGLRPIEAGAEGDIWPVGSWRAVEAGEPAKERVPSR